MRVVRYAAAVVTVLMSLMNVPFAFDDGGAGLPAPLAWLVTLLGVLGLVAAVGLLRRAAWGVPAVLAIGVVNLIGAIVAVLTGAEGGLIGLVVSALITGLSLVLLRRSATPAVA